MVVRSSEMVNKKYVCVLNYRLIHTYLYILMYILMSYEINY